MTENQVKTTEADLVNRLQKASTLAEQIEAVNALDAFKQSTAQKIRDDKDLDWAGTVVGETLRPVAVHERSTVNTDWLATEPLQAFAAAEQNQITAEAAMWYRSLSDEVKADAEEFGEQLKGAARKTAGAYDEHMATAEQGFTDYARFLHRREAASGLPQVQQTHDSQDNPSTTPLPTDVFDNYAPPVHPINEWAVGTESSERAPGLQQIMAQDPHQSAPDSVEYSHHDEAPMLTHASYDHTIQDVLNGSLEFEAAAGAGEHGHSTKEHRDYTPSEQETTDKSYSTPQGFDQTSFETTRMGPQGRTAVGDSLLERRAEALAEIAQRDPKRGYKQPTSDQIQQFRQWARQAHPNHADDYFSNADKTASQHQATAGNPVKLPEGVTHFVHYNEVGGVHDSVPAADFPADGPGKNGWAYEHDETGAHATLDGPGGHYRRYEHYPRPQDRKTAASSLPQVQQVVDNQENPAPTPLPDAVAYPWTIDDGDEQKRYEQRAGGGVSDVEKNAAMQRRAANAMRLLQQPRGSLTEAERYEVLAFTAGMKHHADQWTANPADQRQGPANNPGTAPIPSQGTYDQGYTEGQQSFADPQAGPSYLDASGYAPDYARGSAQGYADASRSRPSNGQMPPGAGNRDFQTHASKKTAYNKGDRIEMSGDDRDPESGMKFPKGTQYTVHSHDTSRPDDDGNTFVYVSEHNNPIDDRFVKKASAKTAIKVSASFVAPVEHADPDFAKGYKYAQRWAKSTRLVSTGSAAFEAGVYAGISDNPASQKDWTLQHRAMAARGQRPEFQERLKRHAEFSTKVAPSVGLSMQGCYLKAREERTESKTAASWFDTITPANREAAERASSTAQQSSEQAKGNDYWEDSNKFSDDHFDAYQDHLQAQDQWNEIARVEPGDGQAQERADRHGQQAADHQSAVWGPRSPRRHASRTAATSTDLDTLAPSTGPALDGRTFVNGPGTRPVLDGQAPPNAPAGPAPYNAAPPYGAPVVPAQSAPSGGPGLVDDALGGPADQAILERNRTRTATLSPAAQRFRNTVQANLQNRSIR